MEIKDRIYEIVATVYSFGANEYEKTLTVKEVATDRIMKLIEEDRHLTNAMHSDAQKQCPLCVDADLVNVPTCPKCGYFERR